MGTVSSRLNSIDREATRSFSGFDKIADRLAGIGTGLTVGITLPLAAAGGSALKFASDFDGAMRQVASLIGDVSDKDFKQLNDQTLALAKSMGVDAVDAAHGLYEAISANIPKENALDFLRVAASTAIAGVTTTGVAVDGLTTLLNAYGLKATEAGAASDAMFQAVNIGKVTFPELAASIGIAASGAKNLGISYTELLAAMATITLQGRTSSEAFTEIQSAMKALISPNKEMNALLKETGFNTGEALIASKGFEGAMQALNTAAKGNNQTLTDGFGRIEGYNAMLHLTGPAAELAAKNLDQMNDSLGATGRAQAEIEKGATRMWQVFEADLKNTAIAAGEQLLPAFKSLLDAAKPLGDFLGSAIQWFASLPKPIQETALGMVALTAAIGPVVFIAGSMAGAVLNIASTVTTFSGIVTRFTDLATMLPGIGTGLSKIFDPGGLPGVGGAPGTDLAGTAGTAGSTAASGAGSTASSVGSTLGTVASVTSIITGVISAGADVYNAALLTNIKDHLAHIEDATTVVAKAIDEGGMRDALSTLKNDFAAFSDGAFSGWYKDQISGLTDDLQGIKTDIESWMYTGITAINSSLTSVIAPRLDDIVSAISAQKPDLTINIPINGPVIGTQAFIDQIKLQLSQQLALQA